MYVYIYIYVYLYISYMGDCFNHTSLYRCRTVDTCRYGDCRMASPDGQCPSRKPHAGFYLPPIYGFVGDGKNCGQYHTCS